MRSSTVWARVKSTNPDIPAELQAVAVDDKVLNAARLIAETAIADAIAAGDPDDIQETQKKLAKANSKETERAEGPPTRTEHDATLPRTVCGRRRETGTNVGTYMMVKRCVFNLRIYLRLGPPGASAAVSYAMPC